MLTPSPWGSRPSSNPELPPSPRSPWGTRPSPWRKVQERVVPTSGDLPPQGQVHIDQVGPSPTGTVVSPRLDTLPCAQPRVDSRKRSASQRSDKDLWNATMEGDETEVQIILGGSVGHADVHFAVEENDKDALIYKGRPVKAQCIHVAALKGYEKVLRLLIAGNADVKAVAEGLNQSREIQPIHFAAAGGVNSVVLLLLEHHAEVEAPALKDGHPHYFPLHDAAWHNRCSTIDVLHQSKARLDASNNVRDTALHLAAKVGHVAVAEFLLGATTAAGVPTRKTRRIGEAVDQVVMNLVHATNNDGKLALDLAVEHGQFPSHKLRLFTQDLDNVGKASAFMKVSKACPAAVPHLLRLGQEEGALNDEPISSDWKESFHQGIVNENTVSVHGLAVLVGEAPQAFMDLIEILTDTPKVMDSAHWPIPIRVALPHDWEFCCLSCEYQSEVDWEFDVQGKSFGRPWHHTFAKRDPKRGSDVLVKVVKLKGILDLELVYYLSVVSDIRVFTKLTVHAALKYMWTKLKWIYWMDILHEITAVLVISHWARGDVSPINENIVTCRLLWYCVASFGIQEGLMLAWAFICILLNFHQQEEENGLEPRLDAHSLFGRRGSNLHFPKADAKRRMLCGCSLRLFYVHMTRQLRQVRPFVQIWIHRIIISVVTIVLACLMDEDFRPRPDKISAIFLSICCLLHWVLLLIRLRAFPWLGKGLLPVMKSVTQVGGMLTILFFFVVGFLHAYWALHLSEGNETMVYDIVLFLFAGEPFAALQTLGEVDDRGMRVYTVILSLLALLVFLCCLLSIFIAVLNDIYDQEQDRVVCTYLQERARICCMMFMRPKIGLGHKANIPRSRCVWICHGLGVLAVNAVLFAGLVHANISLGLSVWAWAAAIQLAVALLLLQGVLRAMLTDGWENLHLWFCHEANADEANFLAEDKRGHLMHNGRNEQIKQVRKEVKKQGVDERRWLKRIFNLNRDVCDKAIKIDSPSAARVASGGLGPPSTPRQALADRAPRDGTFTPNSTASEMETCQMGISQRTVADRAPRDGTFTPNRTALEGEASEMHHSYQGTVADDWGTGVPIHLTSAGGTDRMLMDTGPKIDIQVAALGLTREISEVKNTLQRVQEMLVDQDKRQKQFQARQDQFEINQGNLQKTCDATLAELKKITEMAVTRRKQKARPAASESPPLPPPPATETCPSQARAAIAGDALRGTLAAADARKLE